MTGAVIVGVLLYGSVLGAIVGLWWLAHQPSDIHVLRRSRREREALGRAVRR